MKGDLRATMMTKRKLFLREDDLRLKVHKKS